MTTRDDLVRRLRKQHQQCGVDESGPVFELVPICQEAASALEARDAEIARLTIANSELDEKWRYWQSRADTNESRITSLERQLAEERERCAKTVPTNWLHPIFEKLGPTPYDCPTVETLLRSIAAAIRGGAK